MAWGGIGEEKLRGLVAVREDKAGLPGRSNDDRSSRAFGLG